MAQRPADGDLVKRAGGRRRLRPRRGAQRARSGRRVVVLDDAGRAAPPRRCRRTVAEALRTHLDHYLVMEDAEMAPQTDASRPGRCTGRARARCSRPRARRAPWEAARPHGPRRRARARAGGRRSGEVAAALAGVGDGGRRRRVGGAAPRARRAALRRRLRRQDVPAGGRAREGGRQLRQGLLPRAGGRLHARDARPREAQARRRSCSIDGGAARAGRRGEGRSGRAGRRGDERRAFADARQGRGARHGEARASRSRGRPLVVGGARGEVVERPA